ncbi:HEAT repeat domain-containing protein [Actinoplanes sp. G11-F43]|uniref:HEAT repeat domain-containing protein n=1 Tax=Actinoplanes sp. G11-F43 TaxID=3424130 RepID=UPI003D3492C9
MEDFRPTEIKRLPIDHLMRIAGREVKEDDADAPVPFLVALHQRPVREVFERAAVLVNDGDATRRILGVRVLRELGEQQPDGCRPFTAETIPLLRDRLRKESEPDVLRWIVSALGFHRAREALPEIVVLARHPDARVRFHVAANLTRLVDLRAVDPDAADALIRLCHDDDPDIRYYALYAATREIAGMNVELVTTLTAELRSDPDTQIGTMAARHHQAIDAVRRFLNDGNAGRVFVQDLRTDHYDYMIGPILVALACEAGVPEIRDVLNEEIRRGFGVCSPPVDITNMAERLVAWWRAESAA